MKTVMNVDYEKLFRDAEETLEIAEGSITTLTAYYQHLSQLIELGGPKYIRIPLGEDEFIINTNDRSIKIPDDILTSGGRIPTWVPCVAGDHRAETLWFKVDRYFDGQDLAVCFPNDTLPREEDLGLTYIVWSNGTEDGVGKTPVSYVEIDENEIYFGWILHNGILAKDGELTFAVSFNYYAGRDGLGNVNTTVAPIYSFNTNYVTIPIKKSIISVIGNDITMETITLEDVQDENNFPRFSGIYNSILGPKATILVDLPKTTDLNEDGTVTLSVSALPVGEGATLEYRWYEGGALQTDENAKDREYTVDSVGRYMVSVGNNFGTYTRWTDSDECEIPAATNIELVSRSGEEAYVSGEQFARPLQATYAHVEKGRKKGTIKYTWYRSDFTEKPEYNIVDTGEQVTDSETANYTISYSPTVPGLYKVIATNYHNKTHSAQVDSDTYVVKKNAIIIPSVKIELRESGKIVATVEGNHQDLQFKWFYTNSDGVDVSTGWTKENTKIPDQSGTYYCKVKQVIFEDTELETSSEIPTESNHLPITIS